MNYQKTRKFIRRKIFCGWKTFSFPKESIFVENADVVIPDAAFVFDKGVSNTISIAQCIAVELSTILINGWTLDKSVVWLFTICNVSTVSSNNIDKPVLKLFNVCNTFKPETLIVHFY